MTFDGRKNKNYTKKTFKKGNGGGGGGGVGVVVVWEMITDADALVSANCLIASASSSSLMMKL